MIPDPSSKPASEEKEAQSDDGMLSLAKVEILVLGAVGLLSLFAFLATGSGRGSLLQQFNMSDPLTIAAGILAILLFLPWFAVFCAVFYSNGKTPLYLSSMPARQARDFRADPGWRRFIGAYVWAVSLGTSLNPASTKCPKCGSLDIRRAGPREFAVIMVGGILAVPLALLINFAAAHMMSGVGLAEWISWSGRWLIAAPIVAWSCFQAFVQLPKLRFCPKCGGGGFAPPSPGSERQSENRKALADPAVREAWAATWRAWSAGLYSPNAQKEASRLSVDSFCDKYRSYGRLVASATKQRPLDADEFIVSVGPDDSFVLTNLTFYLFTSDKPIPNPALVVPLSDIDDYRFPGMVRVVITLRSGEVVGGLTNSAPKAEVLNRFRDEQRATTNAGAE